MCIECTLRHTALFKLLVTSGNLIDIRLQSFAGIENPSQLTDLRENFDLNNPPSTREWTIGELYAKYLTSDLPSLRDNLLRDYLES